MENIRIPVDHFNDELRKTGRSLLDAHLLGHGWKDDEYGIEFIWPDGRVEFIGFGVETSRLMESLVRSAH